MMRVGKSEEAKFTEVPGYTTVTFEAPVKMCMCMCMCMCKMQRIMQSYFMCIPTKVYPKAIVRVQQKLGYPNLVSVFSPGPFSIAAPYAFYSHISLMW